MQDGHHPGCAYSNAELQHGMAVSLVGRLQAAGHTNLQGRPGAHSMTFTIKEQIQRREIGEKETISRGPSERQIRTLETTGEGHSVRQS